VLRQGYRLGDRLLRPAMVGVTDPSEPAAATGEQPATDADSASQQDSDEPADAPTATTTTNSES
jgi:molecular chaperone GrpE